MAHRTRAPGRDEQTPPPPARPRIPIVGIGASAGGVRALQTFFEALPPDPGAAFVVIVHLDPKAHSGLPEILAARSKMPVTQVHGRAELQLNCIYVIPPDRQLQISDSEISAEPFPEPHGQRAPIDLFFRSLAGQNGDGFAVVLTGAGSDGAVGVKAIKEGGGIILVQDPEDAEYPSMPRAAIATEAADFVLPLESLTDRLVELIRTRPAIPAAAERPGEQEDTLRRILTQLRVRTGHDFSHYKPSTVMRRITRRLQVARRETLDDYLAYLRENPAEPPALLADLLISVTTFFRDPKAYESLVKHAIPAIFAAKTGGEPIRAWIPGCATGEEAYSIAMLLLEEASKHELRPEIQVFGSDIDARALAIAREGRYPAAIAADVGEDRLRRFFTREEDSYRVKRELRDVVLFASHSVLKDPPFSKLDLVSCRNLLIYLDRDLQQQVLSTLRYGLAPSGFLFLGTSEGADHPDNLFRAVDRDARLFQSTGRTGDRLPAIPHLFGVPALEHASHAAHAAPISARTAQAAHNEALETVAPPSILVDAAHRVLHLSENAGRYLEPSAGPLTNDVAELAHQQLRFELRNALRRAFEHGETVLSPAIYVRFNGAPKRIYVQVRPVPAREAERSKHALVLFIEGQDGEPHATGDGAGEGQGSGEMVHRLRQELEVTQASLRSTREESEATNEELRAANEELQSINEEYRSTSEELETSKEELQSINEELQTVNSELKIKLDTVSRANSDLQNLMSAMEFGVLFLDQSLKIKRFTPKLAGLFSITPADIGRPITDFAHQLDYDSFAKDTQAVLTNLAPIERELRSRSEGWYLVRIRPYRTIDDKIDGVVATFVDITERRRMEEALRRSEQSLRHETRLVEASHAPIFVWDFDGGGILQWNRGCEELYGYSKQEAIGRPVQELLRSHSPGGGREEMRQALLKDGAWHGELAQSTKAGQQISVDAKIELVSMGDRRLALESARDITLSKAWEIQQRLLLDELTHRVKNVLAIVQSIISQTWRSAGTHEDFVERVQGRIVALAEAHKLLFASEWAGVDLRELVVRELAPYGAGRPERVRLSGPTVTLPANVATSMALVLHELATNAAKYGAFSMEAGYVELSWTLDETDKANRLKLIWREHDGPPVTPPSALGFGAGLIRDALPGSEVRHQFDPSGVVCTVEVDLEVEGDGARNGIGGPTSSRLQGARGGG